MRKESLKKQYEELLNLMGMDQDGKYNNVYIYVKDMLKSFMKKHKRVAIYCYGYHTQMLFADFVAELRDVVCIIDNGVVSNGNSELQIIKDADIEKNKLDGIIISSFKYMKEIKKRLRTNHSSVDLLDIYEELENYGLFMDHEYFHAGPYHMYSIINSLRTQIKENNTLSRKRELLESYVDIKDFRLANLLAKEIYEISGDNQDRLIYELIVNIYKSEIDTVSQISKDNILMLCLDGMRREDFYGGAMEKIFALLENTSCFYTNAYSYSTMTYESLVPVFEENTDQKTSYYLREEVLSDNCRFIKKALDDNRFVAIYGDGNHYIYDERIKYAGCAQTITEKLWDFLFDADKVDNGIFYLHELYESHYSFANPYTEEPLVSNGGAMLFDLLPENGGHFKTDYEKQHKDGLNYLDDTLAPFIEVLSCKLVVFSDHGNLILKEKTKLEEVSFLQFNAAEDWIEIPLLIKSKDVRVGRDSKLISLLELNDIMISLMDGQNYNNVEPVYIKIGRSPIYNQHFKELYRLCAKGYDGEAFEGFIFRDGYKLLIFSNGKKYLFRTNDDSLVEDSYKLEELSKIVKSEVTI